MKKESFENQERSTKDEMMQKFTGLNFEINRIEGAIDFTISCLGDIKNKIRLSQTTIRDLFDDYFRNEPM